MRTCPLPNANWKYWNAWPRDTVTRKSPHLYISEHTSRTHIRNIYHKMDVHSRSQAIAKAIRAGLIDFV